MPYAAKVGSATTSAAPVVLTIGADYRRYLYVTSESGAGRLTFTVDGRTATNGGDDMYYVAPVAGASRRVRIDDSATGNGTVSVSIIASVTTTYTLQVDDDPGGVGS